MTIKHSTQKPPNWLTIVANFPAVDWDKGIIVTFGDTYYCKEEISPDLIAHESTHMRQQLAFGIGEWWDRYFIDQKFRLEQEVEAYQNQVRWLKEHTEGMDRNERRMRIKFCAQALASGIYGNIISYEKALALIKS